MTQPQIRFDDGAAYERMMGQWSRRVGEPFLDWIAPPRQARWIDVGCGSGAFTELIASRCEPALLHGIDPAEGQIAFARTRPGASLAQFRTGDAMDLPFGDGAFDVAVMALVIFFVPEPARGVAEMARVVAPGGQVAAYAWDLHGGGFPLEPVYEALRAMGVTPPLPPSADAARLEVLRGLWAEAGLAGVETAVFSVERTFRDFADFWETTRQSSSMRPMLASLDTRAVERLEARLRERLPAGPGGTITYGARAHAIKGWRPKA